MSPLFRIDCGYQNYDWGKIGSASAVARFAAKSNADTAIDENKPYAELWMGTHPSVPSTIVDDKALQGKVLRDVVGGNAAVYLHPSVVRKFGSDKELPFLFKVLSIEKVLSIQAHPDKALAAQLHAADPKNYPDDNHKPEMAIAVTDFEGFCGFKPLRQIAATLQAVPEFRDIVGAETAADFSSNIQPDAAAGSAADKANRALLQKVFGNVMTTSDADVAAKAALLVSRAQREPQVFDALAPGLADLVLRLNKQFPNDIGLFCGCMMLNHVRLAAGEAMFLQAKDPHAYISGDIIECMAASDNVVRAGFTPKFKDVANLVDMLTYSYDPVDKQKMPLLPFPRSHGDAPTSVLYDPPIAEFAVLQTIFAATPGQTQYFDGFAGPSIVIATNGTGLIKVKGSDSALPVETGYVFFIAPGTEIELVSSSTAEPLTTYRAFVEAN
ncbi:mannose-6-phosphate isomerase [Metschnikowia bicuspidata var. bicuspidata NRRL YB-4993]|uniref:Mannose-6-phosphate isomerase n=1 Tax=Metschnikowia bicuspidata var. bicuspidata NRRL YB-4993 TaxID=869754 RepID=A0A1A0HI30_9ASCO|nr:mannose-6-phosphate isomerase [Metschnikowia bicuspidata var. bicuspidata NRRL YB-4993]OBA23537.1 mannose-6-phosphate isomerase [Metschnikowia bicuspidata var. bicuspidata NRRL YB-4993]